MLLHILFNGFGIDLFEEFVNAGAILFILNNVGYLTKRLNHRLINATSNTEKAILAPISAPVVLHKEVFLSFLVSIDLLSVANDDYENLWILTAAIIWHHNT
jgi:hypothetical protein